jgi:hypothetical protein
VICSHYCSYRSSLLYQDTATEACKETHIVQVLILHKEASQKHSSIGWISDTDTVTRIQKRKEEANNVDIPDAIIVARACNSLHC